MNEPKCPQLNNQEINHIISGLNLLNKFHFDQAEYAAALVINVLRDQKTEFQNEIEGLKTELAIAKEQYTIVKQQLLKKKRPYTKRHPKFFKNK